MRLAARTGSPTTKGNYGKDLKNDQHHVEVFFEVDVTMARLGVWNHNVWPRRCSLHKAGVELGVTIVALKALLGKRDVLDCRMGFSTLGINNENP